MAKDKDKDKGKKGKAEAQEQRAPEVARHSAKEKPRLRARFEKELAPVLMKELNLNNPMAVPRLVSVVLARVRDFRGVSTKSFDGRGNYTLGLHDQLIFPEIDYAKVDKTKGMNVTIVTTAGTDDQARTLLKHLGMPFRAQS